jgi:GTPase SAR1 family protein
VHNKSIRARDKLCRLDIIDVGGHEPTNTTWYSKRREETSRDAVVLVYDTTSRKSFEAIPDLFDPTKHPWDAIVMLVGSKIDRKEQRQVQPEEGMELAKKLGGTFWEVSPLRDHGINEMFQYLTLLLLERQRDRLNLTTESKVEAPQKSVWEPEVPQKSLWARITSVAFSCMGRA